MHRLLIAMLLMLTGVAAAHEPMSNECVAPIRPVNDQDDEQWFQLHSGTRSCAPR